MWHRFSRRPQLWVGLPLLLLLVFAVACAGDPTATPIPAPTPTTATAAPVAPTATTAAAAPVADTPTPVAVPKEEPAPFMLSAPEANPKYGGVLKPVGLSAASHFDLHQSSSFAFIYPLINRFDGLVRFDPFEVGFTVVIPDLATSWEISTDALTYTFQLRDGVKWHDGTPFSAEDVKATYDRVIDPPEGVVMIRADLFEALEEINILDPLKVEFVIREPRGFFLSALALGWNTIEQKKTLDELNGDLKRAKDRPGTGAFKFVSYATG